MSDDLPKKLRSGIYRGVTEHDDLMLAAADRIEALELLLERRQLSIAGIAKSAERWQQSFHQAEAELAAERALADQLVSALDRALFCFDLVLARKPCRDAAEMRSEAVRALVAERDRRNPTQEPK